MLPCHIGPALLLPLFLLTLGLWYVVALCRDWIQSRGKGHLATMQAAWIPIVGSIWWFKFIHKVIEDPNGRSIKDIFQQPRTSESIYDKSIPSVPHFSSDCHTRANRKRFPGISRDIVLPAYLAPIDHRRAKKRQSCYEIELPTCLLISVINMFMHYLWHLHPNAAFFNEMNIILISFWLTIGYRIFKLICLLDIDNNLLSD